MVKKAIIPIAGKGTRFLPATKEIPKEILPIINRPMIQYVVDEAVKSGIEQIIFVTSSKKESVENYFDRNYELEEFLESKGKKAEKKLIKEIGELINFITVRQKEQLGLGHAILQAESVIGDESFAVLLGDDIILSDVPVTKQLIDISKKNKNAPVIGVMEVPREETNKYGIIAGKAIDKSKKTLRMQGMVEKPAPAKAPTNLATPGRYILNAEIFDHLRKISKGSGGEYQLTDAIDSWCKKREVLAHCFKGDRFDTGNVKGYLNATLEFALRDESLRDFMVDLMKTKLKDYRL